MEKKNLKGKGIVGLLFILLVISSFAFVEKAMAVPVDNSHFTNPPETNAKVWDYSYPYYRNIYWDFSTDPTTNPATGYYGAKDALLKSSDFVSFTGAVGYDSANHRIGAFEGSGTAVFHLANLPNNGSHQYLWLEMNVYTSTPGEGKNVDPSVTVPLGYNVTDSTGTGKLTTGLHDVWFKIEPAPTSEDLVLSFAANGNNKYAYVDNLHVAATPEPIGAALFVIGAGALGIIKNRRNRKKA